MNRALFTRKPVNIGELKRRTGEESEKSPFIIVKVIELPTEQFKDLSQNLLRDYEFIKDLVDLAYVDPNGVWHCVLIKEIGGVEGIVSNFEGYFYCRYCSYIPDCTALLEQTENHMTEKIKEQIIKIRDSGVCNMLDVIFVQRVAYEKGFNELVIFIEDYKKEYSNFILTGKK